MASKRTTLTTRYGDACEVLEHGTRGGKPAVVRRVRDGLVMRVFPEDVQSAGGPTMAAYYGTTRYDDENVRMSGKLREMRAALPWREVRGG